MHQALGILQEEACLKMLSSSRLHFPRYGISWLLITKVWHLMVAHY
jgi:hypothetical protein